MTIVQKVHNCKCSQNVHGVNANFCIKCGRKLDARNTNPEFEAMIRKMTGAN